MKPTRMPTRTGATARRSTVVAAALTYTLVLTLSGVLGAVFPGSLESAGLDVRAAAESTQVAPPVGPQRPPTARPATPPPARPATPPVTRPTTPPATPPAGGTAEDDLPEGLRVRPVPPMRNVVGGPGIHFEVLDHHFGTMTNAETRFTTFAFINTGDAPLVLDDVVAACACTRPTFEKGRSYAPGERGVIEVAFTPPTGGHQAKSMSVISNALPPNNLVRIRTIGDVEAVLSFEPKVHDVGEIELGKAHESTFSIVADAATTFFDGVVGRGRDMTVALVGDAPQQGSATLAVGFPATLPWGRITSGAVMVSTRGSVDERTITKDLPLRVVGVVVDDIRADEYVIQLGFVDPGAAFVGETRVYHKDGKAIEIIGALVEPMAATMRGVADAEYRVQVLPSTDPEKPGQIVRITGQSRGPQGFLTGSIKFRVTVDGAVYGGERSVGVNGRVAPPDRQIPMTPAGR